EQKQYEEQKRKKKKLKASIRQKKQWVKRGSKQTPADNDKYIRGYRRDQSAKIAKAAKSIKGKLIQMNQFYELTEKKH
ncbi:MAG: hypothetical protein ACTSRG_26500, partial [Candidatus Helarchaeota archaeon]